MAFQGAPADAHRSAQLNPVVGDFKANSARILEAVRRAEEQGAELVLTPELSLWGYPPRDQLLEPSRIEQQDSALQWLVNQLNSSVTLLVGAALPATCLLYTSPSPRDRTRSRMPSSA